MISETDIANLALNLLCEKPIADINDNTDTVARTVKVVYAQERNKLLERCQWSFATKMTTISKLAEAPVYKWSAYYQLPSDFIRLIEIDRVDAWLPKEYFDIHGRKLCLNRTESTDENADTVDIEYIFRQEDSTLYTPLFCDALAYAVASRVARPLTGSDQKAERLLEQLEQIILPQAMTRSLQQVYSGKNHPIRTMLGKSFIGNARHAGGAAQVGLEP